MYEVKDKVFFVTGGAGGIGAGAVKAFLEEGAKYVAILDVDAKNGIALESELAAKFGADRVKFHKCDITTDGLTEVYDQVLAAVGYIDVVLNNAAIMNDHPNVYEKSISVNVTALIKSSLTAYNFMRKDKGGRGGTIINISSIAALIHGPLLPVYHATKSAVLQFSVSLGGKPNYGESGVRVLAICFGCTDTSLLSPEKADIHDDKFRESFFQRMSEFPWQTPESAVCGLVDSYKQGASASIWLVTSNKPARDISGNVAAAYKILAEGIMD